MSIRRATPRAASAIVAVASVLLLATCDIATLTKPNEGGTPGNPFDSTELTLNILGATTVNGATTIPVGGTATMNVTSASVSLDNVVKRYSSAGSAIIIDSITGVMTGVTVGPSATKVTATILAPELGAGVTISQQVRVRYAGLKFTTPLVTDTIKGLGPAQNKTATVFGTNASGSNVLAVTPDSIRSRDTSIFKITGTTINGRKNGTAQLVAFFDGLRDSVAVRVRQVAKNITFPTVDYTARHMNFGITVPIATVTDLTDSLIPAASRVMRWRTKDTTRAAVDSLTGVLRVKVLAGDTIFARMDTVERKQRIVVSQVVGSLVKFQGDARSDTVAKNVTVVPTVTAVDSGATPIVGASVTFRTGLGLNASVNDTLPVTTNGLGRAAPTSWKLGDVAGTNNNTLVATSGTQSATFTVTAVPQKAFKLTFAANPTSASINGAINPAITVRITDSLGNTVASTANVTLAIGNNPGAATLGGTLTQAAVAGVATFSNITLNQAGSGYTLVASSGVLQAGTSNGFDIFGIKNKLGFFTQPTTTSAGAVMSNVRVAVQDAAGNTVGNATDSVTIAFANNAGGGALGGTLKVAAVNGIATFSTLTVSIAAAGYTLQATPTNGGLNPATSAAFTVTPVGAPAKLAFSVQPSTVVAGVAIAPAIKVQIQDAAGALVTGSTQQVTLAIESTSPAGGTLSGTLPKNAVSGEVTFSDLSINKAGAGFKLLATAPGASLTSATSNAFTVTTGTATKLGFVQQPTHTISGQSIAPAVTVEVQDASGNRVTTGPTFSVTLALSSCAGPVLSGGGAQTTASGVATFSALQLSALGTNCVLTATASGLASSPGSNTFNSTAANGAAKVSFTTEPSATVTAGAVFATAPVVAFQDASGAAATASTSTTITLSVLSGPATGFSGGTTTGNTTTSTSFANLKFNTAGSYRILASANGFDPDTSQIITVNPSTASQWGVKQQPSNTVAGVPFSPVFTAAVQDQFGNTIPGATTSLQISAFISGAGSILFSAGPGLINNGNNAVATAVNGVATFTGLAPKTSGNNVLICTNNTGALNGFCTSPFNVSTGPVSKLGFVVQPPNTATAGAVMTPAIQVAGQDSVGNTVADFGNAITVAMTGGSASATFSGTKTVAPTAGVASFNDLAINIASTNYQLSASASGLTTANSNLFNVQPEFLYQCCPGMEDFVILGSTMYFLGNSALKSVPVAGTTVTTIVGTTNPAAITTDGTNIYWAERGTNNNGDAFIKKLTVSNGTVSTLTVGQTNLMDWAEMKLASDGVNVYFVSRNADSTGYAIKTVGVAAVSATPTQIFTASTFNPIFFQLSGGNLYFFEGSGSTIRRMPSAGGVPTALSDALANSPKYLTLSGTTLFFNDGVTLKSIASANTAGSAVTPATLGTAPGTVYEVASDGSFVYVNGGGTLRRYLASDFATFVDLVVASPTVDQWHYPFLFDATHLYFHSNFGRLARVPK